MGLRLLHLTARAEVWSGSEDEVPTREEIIAGVRRAGTLLCLLTESIDRGFMEANPGILGIANYAGGYNNTDIKAATELVFL